MGVWEGDLEEFGANASVILSPIPYIVIFPWFQVLYAIYMNAMIFYVDGA